MPEPALATLTEVLAVWGAVTGTLGVLIGALQYWRGRPTFNFGIGVAKDRKRRWTLRGDRWDLARSAGESYPGPITLKPGEFKEFVLTDAVTDLRGDEPVAWERLRPYVRDGRTGRIVWARKIPLPGGWGSIATLPVPYRQN